MVATLAFVLATVAMESSPGTAADEGHAVTVAAMALAAQAGAVEGEETPAGGTPSCEYLDDIRAISLPGEAGQPSSIAFTRNDFATYRRNLGFPPDYAAGFAGRRVLDVAAGLSDFVDVMADQHGAEAVAIDVVYAEIDLSGLSAACVEAFHRRRFAMDATRMLFPSNYFDLVVSHSLLKWFFLADAEPGGDLRLRMQRGMDILSQMVRVTSPAGEVRVNDFPDPHGEWFARAHPDMVDEYRAAYRRLQAPICGRYSVDSDAPSGVGGESGEPCYLDLDFAYDDEGAGYTVIRKLERIPRGDARGAVSVIRAPRRPTAPPPDRADPVDQENRRP
jgi:ubiquinone/menaquinone biosynthesis C-methylase UbiE